MSQALTMRTVNTMLSACGFPSIDPATAQRIKGADEQGRFPEALEKARRDPNAKRWIAGLLRHVGVRIDDSAAAPATARSAEPQTPAPAAASIPSEVERDYLSFHVYGGKAALCFGADQTRRGLHTVYLDAAPAVGEREYDWTQRIRIQLTRIELPEVAAVLLGYLPKCEFGNHGAEQTKGFAIEAQQGKFFVKVWQKGNSVRAVPMILEDAFYVSGLLLRQLGRAFEGGGEVPVAHLVREYARLKSGR